MPTHNTEKTCADLNQYLSSSLENPLNFKVLCENDYCGFDEKPVAAVMINGQTTIYPHEECFETVWAVDIIDDSENTDSVCGGTIYNHAYGRSFMEAVSIIGGLLKEEEDRQKIVAEDLKEIERADRLCQSTIMRIKAWEIRAWEKYLTDQGKSKDEL